MCIRDRSTTPTSTTPTSTGGTLLVSKKKDRSEPVELDGSTVRGKVYIFATAPTGVSITSVDFFLNGKRVQTERNAPYDFNGGSVEVARSFDVRDFKRGSNTVTAVFRTTTGDVSTSATFTRGSGRH